MRDSFPAKEHIIIFIPTMQDLLNRLEAYYGVQAPTWPTDPYEFLIWWHCGYPASDAACSRGWESLNESIGIRPEEILGESIPELARALRPGGMIPEQRAMRLKEIADRVQNWPHGDFLKEGSAQRLRKQLKQFPNISDPGADRILLFADLAPVAAVPSNCPYVLVRMVRGQELENYGKNYRVAQAAIEDIPTEFAARKRAYLLLKRHGQELCKRSNPKCDACPVSPQCAFFARM
jgi:endonuclease-3